MNALRTFGFCILAGAALLALAQDSKPPRGLEPRPAEIAPLAADHLLLALAVANGTVVAVGDRGTILLSGDGEQWQQSTVPVQATLTTVAFADAQHGWAAGHDAAILRTSDGGKNWTLQNFQPVDSRPVLALLALDAQQAFAVGAYGMFLTTADGGSTWTALEAPALLEDGRHLYSIIRLGNGEFFIAGETGLAAVSSDGRDWQRLSVPYEGSLFGALPHGDKGALVYGLRGNVLITDDVRSNRWTAVATGTVHSIYGGARLADGTAVLVGADGAMLRVGADGKAALVNVAAQFGTLAAVLPWQERLVLVGENGANHVALPQ